MQQRLSIITLGVSDLKKSEDFYNKLGWKKSGNNEGIVCYNLQSMAFALYPIEKLAEDKKIDIPRSNLKFLKTFSIAHNVENEKTVDNVLKEAENAGGKITKPAQKTFWGGYSGYFSDPDGYLWEVAFNPFSKLGKNGEFQWEGVQP